MNEAEGEAAGTLSAEQHRQLARPAYRAFRPRHGRRRIEVEVRDALEPLLQRDLDLHAREIRADAAVNAEAEGGVAVLLAVDHHALGIREDARIAVRRREREQHHFA